MATQYGPFTAQDSNTITAVLEAHDVPFILDANHEELARKEAEWKQQRPSQYGATPLDASHIYLEIDEADLAKLGDALAGFGIAERFLNQSAPLLDGDEYLCDRCNHHAFEPGNCPKHRQPLLTFSDYAEAKRKRAALRNRVWAWIVLVSITAMMIYLFNR